LKTTPKLVERNKVDGALFRLEREKFIAVTTLALSCQPKGKVINNLLSPKRQGAEGKRVVNKSHINNLLSPEGRGQREKEL